LTPVLQHDEAVVQILNNVAVAGDCDKTTHDQERGTSSFVRLGRTTADKPNMALPWEGKAEITVAGITTYTFYG
jgi:hypothetical protein